MEQRSEEKFFKQKKENGNISFNFYQQLMALVTTEMQIQLYKY